MEQGSADKASRKTVKMKFEDASGTHYGRVFEDDYIQLQMDGGCDMRRFLEMVDAAAIKPTAAEIAAEAAYAARRKVLDAEIAVVKEADAKRAQEAKQRKEMAEEQARADLRERVRAKLEEEKRRQKQLMQSVIRQEKQKLLQKKQEQRDRYHQKRLEAEMPERVRLVASGTLAPEDAPPAPIALVGRIWRSLRQRLTATA